MIQLSDTHFLEDGAEPEGFGAYDTDAAFDAVLAHIGDHLDTDLVVVTGDVADHGLPGEYAKAATALDRFEVPVNACPGNHDFVVPFNGVGRPGVNTSRVIESGNWAFLFVDSSSGVMSETESGLAIDPPAGDRLHNDGVLSPREVAWIQSACDATTADHVFIWLHHPPDAPVPLTHDADYAAQWRSLLPSLPKVRGMGGGHTHIPEAYELDQVPVFVCPALKNNFSLEAETWLPPGYRSYEFFADGTVTSEVHLVDDERWPRRRLGRAIKSLFQGELTYAELEQIAIRKAAK